MNAIWTNTTEFSQFSSLHSHIKTDVLVIGGGIAGILCAHMIREAGIQCVLTEADRLCSGVTSNTTAKITSQHGLIYAKLLRTFGTEIAKGYWQANEEALANYRTLCRNIPCDFELKNSFVYSINDPAKLVQELETLQRLSIPGKLMTDLPLPMKTAGAVCFEDQAQFHPLKFLQGLTEGLTVYENTPVRSFENNTVHTDHGTIRAEHIIIATHFPILNKHGSYFLKLYQNRSYVLSLRQTQLPDGMYIDAEEGGFSFRTYGDQLLLGEGAHRTGKPSDGWKPLELFARKHYPSAVQTGRWATQDCMSLDGIPYIGRYSKRTHNLYVTTGFNKWGMTSAMVGATLLRDLVQSKSNPYEEIFSPSRTILRPQLLTNGLETAKSLLTPSKPRCPHMGCALKWNRQEHSWDCPCHGSRFDPDGKLLNDPAMGDLL